MIPIAKNISVVDQNGKLLEPTYPRRAKGLVKNGRAIWVQQTTICLNSNSLNSESTEVDVMDNHVFEYIKEQIEFLKQDISKEVPLNLDSQYQPEAAAKIYEMKTGERQQIMKLLDRLIDLESGKE